MKSYALPVSIVVLALALVASVFFYNSTSTEASVAFGNDYVTQHITASGTSSPAFCRNSLGSVVLTSSSAAGDLFFYATTTETATNTADLMFSFDGTAAEGTYTYDAEITAAGVLIEARDWDGDAVVTCR